MARPATRLVLTMAVGALACSSSGAAPHDAAIAIDVPLQGAREHDPDTQYPEAGPPGALGLPLQGTERRWTWVDFPDSRCRDGSSTGIGINLSQASPNVMVFLDQGGACFNPLTCAFSATHLDAVDFGFTRAPVLDEGVFNRTDPDNPMRDWSFVFVPYCSGDVHAGNSPFGSVDGVGPQQFLGYKNLDVFLSRVVPTFSDARQVLLAGSSAGGFGVLLNADHVARWFAPIPVTVLSDSGPPMPSTVVDPCLLASWSNLWGFDQGVRPDCGADCPNPRDYMIDHVLHYGWRYPNTRGGIISATQDATNITFFSFGRDNCAGGQLAAADFQAGLLDARAQLQQNGAPFGTYYIPGTGHIWLMSDGGFATSVNGTPLNRWLADLLAGSISHVGP